MAGTVKSATLVTNQRSMRVDIVILSLFSLERPATDRMKHVSLTLAPFPSNGLERDGHPIVRG